MEHVTEKGLLKPEVSLILQNVFTTCDEEKHGTVKVSKLITFMKEKATETEVFDYLNDLSLLLDGDGTDPSIDWSKCEKGMQKWIQVVNEKSISDVNSSPPAKKTLFLNNNNNNNKLSPNSSVINKSLILEASSLMSTYSNDSMETSELSWENSDLQIRIDELEITNKRLLEDMIKLKQHLDVTEDQNSSFLHENDDLQKQVLRYEKLLDESKLVAKNYEELKATVHEYHSFKNDLVEKTCELEKENTSLQIALKKCEDKVIQLDNNLETLKEEKENLNKDLISQKQLFQQIDDLTSSKDDISEEFVNKSEYMSSLIAELSLANEVLKAQKNTVENELSEIKQEMSRNSMLNRFPGIHSTPMLSSTKCDKWPQSLDQELKEGMENSVDLDGSHIQSFYDFSDGSDNSSLLKNLPHKDRYTMFAQQCRTKFEEKKEIIFDKIEEIVLNRKTSGNMENASMIFDDLNTDFELFTEKITELAQEKQDAEKRALKLASALRKLKDDNKFLQNSKDKALLKFGCLSISSMELEERKSELIQELSEKDRTVAKLKEEILQMQEGLVEKKKSSKKLISCTTESTQTSEITSENITEQQQQVQDLKKLVKSLESRNFEFSRKVFELEEREDVIDKLRQDLLFKDDALSTLKIKYEQELSAIFQIIPNNVSSLPTKVSAITSKDIADHLLHFLKRSKHEYNRLLFLVLQTSICIQGAIHAFQFINVSSQKV